MDLEVHYISGRGHMTPLTLPFNIEKTSGELVSLMFSQPDVRKTLKRYQPTDFCLKVLGTEEYLLEDIPLMQYKVHTCSTI